MTKSTITRERLEKIKSWRETYGAGSNVMLPAEEAEELARMMLAAMDSEPVAWMHNNNNIGIPAITVSPKIGNYWMSEFKDVQPLYRHAQQPVVPDAYVRDEHGRMMLNGVCEPKIGFGTGWNACCAAMLQAGNSPVIPEGYVMVPKEPTEQMYDAGDRQMATKQVWDAMLAAAPQQHNAPQNIPEIIPGWIPVSERMPEPGILVLVYTPPQPGDYPGDVRIGFDYIDPDGDDPTYWFNHGESYEHFCCVACDGMTGPSEKAPYTHWMPLPAAPQEVKGD
ncbi:DUF551 domain-containing protein [Klebsiella michiganensis]|uniref:DUF551 domain-containing protein n=1 Tax=Klebsiella michiganensis TaxID=1134687 RepID=UPI003F8D5051